MLVAWLMTPGISTAPITRSARAIGRPVASRPAAQEIGVRFLREVALKDIDREVFTLLTAPEETPGTEETLASRIAGSQLHAIGLPELVTERFADYEALALELATQPQLLLGYRARLAANRHTHPLFDMARYSRDFELAMQRVWDDYLSYRP